MTAYEQLNSNYSARNTHQRILKAHKEGITNPRDLAVHTRTTHRQVLRHLRLAGIKAESVTCVNRIPLSAEGTDW